MGKKLLVFSLVLGLCSMASAATFDWNNGAVDGDWYNPANWTVTGGSTTFPTEGTGYYTNADVGTINITDGSTVNTGIGGPGNCSPGTTAAGLLNITNGSTFNVTGQLWVCDPESGVAFDVNVDNSTLTTGGVMDFGNGANSVVNVTATNSTLTAGGSLKFANHGGSNVTAVITNSTTTVAERYYQNDAGATNLYSDVTFDGGTLDIALNMYVNDDAGAGSEAYLLLTGGVDVTVGGFMTMPWVTDGIKTHITVDDATLTIAGLLAMGYDGGPGTVESRLFLMDGTVQVDDLGFEASDSVIVYTGGQLLVNNANMTVVDMTALIGTKIDVSGAAGYEVTTIGGYTALIPEPATMALLGLGGLALMRRKRR
jgi:hypothetical protein